MTSSRGTRCLLATTVGAAAALMPDFLPHRSVGFALAQPGPVAAEGEHDRMLIEGTWRVVSIEVNGSTNTSEDVRKITTENDRDGGWRLLVDGKEIAAGTSSIDPAASPKTIDLEFTSGGNAGQTSYGIYEADKQSRRICYAEAGRPRPADFSTGEGSGRILVVFERIETER